MQSKLPLLPSGPGGVRKSTVHGPWQQQCAEVDLKLQEEFLCASRLRREQANQLGSTVQPPELVFLAHVKKAQDMDRDDEQVKAHESPKGLRAEHGEEF